MNCVILDDSAGFLAAARRLLEQQGLTVSGVASTGDEALLRLQELAPDVVLVDLDLGGESGLAVAARLHDRPELRSTAIILISTHAEDDYHELIADSPAIGFVPKQGLSAPAVRRLLDDTASGTPGT